MLDLFPRPQVYSGSLVMLTSQTSFVVFSKDKVTRCIKQLFFPFSIYFGVFTASSHGH